jgi:hypothetical protein
MKILNQDAVQSADEEKTSTDSSTEGKTADTNEEASQDDWDNQPESASLKEETSENKKEKSVEDALKPAESEDSKTIGLEKEFNRQAQLLEDLKAIREEKNRLKKELADKTDTTTDYGFDYETELTEAQKLERLLDRKLAERETQKGFYAQHADIYTGESGEKNKQAVEDYIKLRYNTTDLDPHAINDLREFVHNKYFGAYEKDTAVRKAKTQVRTEMLMNDLAATGSDKGKTSIKTAVPPRKSILPKYKPVAEWYKT